jgi:hypothetical protein
MVIIEFYTKEACNKSAKVDKIKEIPCVIYNKVDKKKRDLSPLIKLSGLYIFCTCRSNALTCRGVDHDIFLQTIVDMHSM